MDRLTRLMSFIVTLMSLTVYASAEDKSVVIKTSQHSFTIVKVTEGIESPAGIDWLPNGQFLVVERKNGIRLVNASSNATKLLGLVSDHMDQSIMEYCDVAVSPNYSADGTIYFSFVKFDGKARWLNVAKAKVGSDELLDVEVVHLTKLNHRAQLGLGSRLRFDKRGNLVVSVSLHNNNEKNISEVMSASSIFKVNLDAVFGGRSDVNFTEPNVIVFNLSNPKGLAIFETSEQLFVVDYKNKHDESEDLMFSWGIDPKIDLTGLEIYTGTDFPHWDGDLFVGSANYEAIIRIMVDDDGKVFGNEFLIHGQIGQVNEIKQGPDGRLYVLTDEESGAVYRIEPTY